MKALTGDPVALLAHRPLTSGPLLIAWCVFTGTSSVSLDFSQSNSHWMWLVGLVLASGGGLIGLIASRESKASA